MEHADVTPEYIKSDRYTYLVDTGTVLWVQTPSPANARVWLAFLAFGGLAVSVGLLLENGDRVALMIAIFVALFFGWHLVRSYGRAKGPSHDWVLFVGSGDNQLEIFRSNDRSEFEAKRDEIERALTARPADARTR